MNFTRLDWIYAGSASGALGAATLVLFLRYGWRRDADEVERRRREYVNRIGRIAHAEIVDVVETEVAARIPLRAHLTLRARTAPPALRRVLVLYRYWVSGVVYETAQDLTLFASSLRLANVRQIASVKYDPAKPSNSILAADTWSGLRESTPSANGPQKGR